MRYGLLWYRSNILRNPYKKTSNFHNNFFMFLNLIHIILPQSSLDTTSCCSGKAVVLKLCKIVMHFEVMVLWFTEHIVSTSRFTYILIKTLM